MDILQNMLVMEKQLKRPELDFREVTVSKKDAGIIADLILRESAEINKIRDQFTGRGLSIPCELKCYAIDLKYLLEQFSKASE